MSFVRSLAPAAVLAALLAVPALADDRPLPGTKLLLKSGRGQKLLYLYKGRILNVPGSTLEPKTYGALLRIINPDTGETASFDLPASGWSGPDTDDPARRVRKFRGGRGAPVRAISFRPLKGLKIVAAATGISLDEPSQSSVGIVLSIRDFLRYCTVFGGTITKNQPGKFSAKAAPAPAACPIALLCGNGTLDESEECEPTGSCPAGQACVNCQCVGQGDVSVQLVWENTNDLDLHVVEPDGAELYYGNDTVASGGSFDTDANRTCGTVTRTPVENAAWAAGTAPTGTFTVLVSLFEACQANAVETPFTVIVTVDGVTTMHPGTIGAADSACGACTTDCSGCTQVLQFTR